MTAAADFQRLRQRGGGFLSEGVADVDSQCCRRDYAGPGGVGGVRRILPSRASCSWKTG
jgi:hypothetical protein